MSDRNFSPIDLQILNKLLSSIAEEMGIVLQRSSFSANIKERRDFSCALFDGKARLLAQAAHIPVHLGAMPMTVATVLEYMTPCKGDIIWTNDPFSGGTHLPDITMILPVFFDEICRDDPLFYLVCRAHHADVGGKEPGSMSLANSIEEEGILIRPECICRAGSLDNYRLDRFLSEVRRPDERMNDIKAQIACLMRGADRLYHLVESWSWTKLQGMLEPLLDYGHRVMKKTIASIPSGTYEFCDALDDDGIHDTPIQIRLRLTVDKESVILDFSDSDDQAKTGINTVKSVTCSCCYYVFQCLQGEEYPVNHGAIMPINIITRRGSIVDAKSPAPVAAGNVETSQRIVDVILGALAQAIPDVIPAASCGSMNNISFGGELENGKYFSYYETIGGGMGARPYADGLSAVQTHMTNTLNTPIEALEHEYPVLIERYAIRRGSGGNGQFRGGDGIIRS